jgi:nucleotide-binding universal stress UspA family protein
MATATILTALDESERAPAVLAAALRLARALPAKVHLLRVLTFPPEIAAAGHTVPDHLEQKLEQDARRELAAFMGRAPDVDFGPALVVGGDPWHRILQAADQVSADLIVIGRHHAHGLERLIGTVASKVVAHAERDVLVVHDPGPGAPPA